MPCAASDTDLVGRAASTDAAVFSKLTRPRASPPMLYRVLVPKEPTDAIPRGAAILEHGCGSALVLGNVNEPFGERCAQAARHGRLMPVPDGCIEVGHYESTDGELRLQHRGAHPLAGWLGHRRPRSPRQPHHAPPQSPTVVLPGPVRRVSAHRPADGAVGDELRLRRRARRCSRAPRLVPPRLLKIF